MTSNNSAELYGKVTTKQEHCLNINCCLIHNECV